MFRASFSQRAFLFLTLPSCLLPIGRTHCFLRLRRLTNACACSICMLAITAMRLKAEPPVHCRGASPGLVTLQPLDQEQLLRDLATRYDGSCLKALRVLRRYKHVTKSVQERVIALAQDSDMAIRIASLEAIGSCRFDPKKVFLVCRKALFDTDTSVRLAVLSSVAPEYPDAEFRQLWEQGLNDASPQVRAAAINAIQKIGTLSKNARRIIWAEALSSEKFAAPLTPDFAVEFPLRAEAALCLAACHSLSQADIDTLEKVLRDNGDPLARVGIAVALGVAAMNTDKDCHYNHIVAEALDAKEKLTRLYTVKKLPHLFECTCSVSGLVALAVFDPASENRMVAQCLIETCPVDLLTDIESDIRAKLASKKWNADVRVDAESVIIRANERLMRKSQ